MNIEECNAGMEVAVVSGRYAGRHGHVYCVMPETVANTVDKAWVWSWDGRGTETFFVPVADLAPRWPPTVPRELAWALGEYVRALATYMVTGRGVEWTHAHDAFYAAFHKQVEELQDDMVSRGPGGGGPPP